MKDKINKLLKKKKPRYITKKFMGDELYNEVLNRTSYLPKDSKIPERLYHIINDIFEPIKCLCCGKNIFGLHKFDITLAEFTNKFCSRKCTASYEYNMNSHVIDVHYNKWELIKYIKENFDVEKLRRDVELMDCVKHYINTLIGVDYKRMSSSESLYFIKNDLKTLPKCPVTKKYLNYLDGGKYRKHVSCKAAGMDKTTLDKRVKTVKERYNVDNVSKHKEVKEKIHTTMRNRYNGDLYVQTDEYKNRIKTGDIINKMSDEGKKSMIESQYKRAWDRINSFSDIVKPLFPFEEYSGCGFDKHYKWLCVKTGKSFYGWYHQALIPKSPYLYDGSDIECFVRDYLKNNNINFQKNTKSIIHPFEVDFYLPDYNIAIECNGLYWHSEAMGKDRGYHLNKTNLCKEKGVRLLHVFSDEILLNPKIITSKLDSIFKRNKIRVFARKCKVKTIDNKTKSKFLEKYHLQGNDNASVRLGLYYRGRLLSVMTFGKKRIAMGHISKEGEYELIRFCNNYNTYVIGGAGKLLKYFERNYNPSKVLTYADKRLSEGGMYLQLGFNHLHDSKPNYHYTKNFIQRFHRFNFRKSELNKKLDSYDPQKTEQENMLRNGWHRVWDCGTMVFEKKYTEK